VGGTHTFFSFFFFFGEERVMKSPLENVPITRLQQTSLIFVSQSLNNFHRSAAITNDVKNKKRVTV